VKEQERGSERARAREKELAESHLFGEHHFVNNSFCSTLLCLSQRCIPPHLSVLANPLLLQLKLRELL